MKKQIFAEKQIFTGKQNDECNPDRPEFHIGFRYDALDADLRRNIHRDRDLRALASQSGRFRRGVENAVAGGMMDHDRA
jgi:hypothetical protein